MSYKILKNYKINIDTEQRDPKKPWEACSHFNNICTCPYIKRARILKMCPEKAYAKQNNR